VVLPWYDFKLWVIWIQVGLLLEEVVSEYMGDPTLPLGITFAPVICVGAVYGLFFAGNLLGALLGWLNVL